MIISSSASATEPSKTIRVSSVATDNGNKSTSSVFARLGGKQSFDDDLVTTTNQDVIFSGILKKSPEKVE